MIAVRALNTRLGREQILHDVNFAAGPGEFVAICGPNGAGKTTLLRALAGLLPGGRPDPRRIAYVEQGARCTWPLTVQELATLGRIPWNDTAQTEIAQALTDCGIAHLAHRGVTELSGGQARRAMLARALATQAPILLLDEPVADLDPRAAHDIMALLARLAQQGRCVIAVLHAVELAVAHATRMLLLADGRVIADGSPAAILPAAAACFGMTIGLDSNPRLLVPTSGVS